MTNCICGEINARNCPVHQVNYREFWINIEFAQPYPDENCTRYPAFNKDLGKSHHLHVIEYAALQAEQERHVDDVAKLQKELNEARADIDRLQAAWEKAVSSEGDWACIADEKQKQITELRNALEFYACWTNWSQIPGKPDVYPIIQFDHEEVKMYGKEKPDIISGKRAREVLNKFGSGEG